VLGDVEILFSGWGAPKIDKAFLEAAPKLEAVFYGAGSVRSMVTEAFWERGIVLSSAWGANAVPVAEFTLAHVILALKHAHLKSREMRAAHGWPSPPVCTGAYGVRVGLIGMGMIGRLVVERLQSLEIEIWASDPFLNEEKARQIGVRVTDLETLFRESHVVSLHAPLLDSTRGMLTGAHFRSMRKGATFINTARGAIVRETELIAVLQERPDLFAVLDVFDPEPPVPASPLYTLPNVSLTPHLAGSVGNECWRMGDYMLEEAKKYLAGDPLKWQVTRRVFEYMA
jgi:phosphoglycerate dehydrogenase-like enzyme